MANHSQQQETTSLFFSASECIAWLTVFGIEAVAKVTLNALGIIIYLKERSLCKRSMSFVINQAVADMFVAGFVIVECWFLGGSCDFWAINSISITFSVLISSFGYLFPLASLLNLTAIALDRTHATFRPFKHRLLKKKIFGVVIMAVWITAGLFTINVVLSLLNQLSALKDILLSYFSFFLFCLLSILVSYSSIAIKIVCGNQPHHHGATSRERKLTKTLFIVTVVSLLLTLPFLISKTVGSNTLPTYIIISRRKYFLLFLCYANSLVNPVFYAFRIPEFKRALFSVLH